MLSALKNFKYAEVIEVKLLFLISDAETSRIKTTNKTFFMKFTIPSIINMISLLQMCFRIRNVCTDLLTEVSQKSQNSISRCLRKIY